MKHLKVLAIALSMPSLIVGASLFFIELKKKQVISEMACIIFIALIILSNLAVAIKFAMGKKE